MAKLQFYLVLLLSLFSSLSAQSSVWTFTCNHEEKLCSRQLSAETTEGVPMDICKLNCDPFQGSLFPLPSGQVSLGPVITGFYPENVDIAGFEGYPDEVRKLFGNASEIFGGYLHKLQSTPPMPGQPGYNDNQLSITLSAVKNDETILTLETDESYNLTVSTADNKTVNVNIQAITFYGARHGLETLSQLIAFDEDNDVLQIVNSASITNDKPAYKYRGVSLDTSRNFISLAGLKRLVDGMSYNKLNMFHWHITDSNSFPMEVNGNPNFTAYGAISRRKVYSLDDMRELVNYARPRGVKIVPELDQPAHMGFGWDWGPSAGKGNLVVCQNQQPWHKYCLEPPCGQINIANPEIYPLLETIYTSMFSIFDHDIFHMGGDEVHNGCYNSSQEITEYMAAKGYDRTDEGFIKLWGEFQLESYNRLKSVSNNANMKTIMWTSELTKRPFISDHLPREDYYIQIWTDKKDQVIPDLVEAGYKTIFSNSDALYLDCGFPAWVGGPLHNWCSPYNTWQEIYDNSPIAIYAEAVNDSRLAEDAFRAGMFLGGETALWTEQADELSFETRIFPRAAAHAERMWTNPRNTGYSEAEFRMVTNRQRMVDRGVHADRMQPEFCDQYQDNCFGPPPEEVVPTTTTESPATCTTPEENGSTTPSDPNVGIKNTFGGFTLVSTVILYFIVHN